MSKTIYLDTDAIVNAIKAGIQAGDATAVLDLWSQYAQSIGAEIKVTDVVLDELGDGEQGQVFGDWMNQNGVAEVETGLTGDSADLGEKSIAAAILNDMASSGSVLSDYSVISDNKAELGDANWVKTNFDIGDRLDAVDFINDNVIHSSDALNAAAASTGMSYADYAELVAGYQANPSFNPESPNYNKSQGFFDEGQYNGFGNLLDSSDGSGPVKFGGFDVHSGLVPSGMQDLVNSLAGDVNALNGALGYIGGVLLGLEALKGLYDARQAYLSGNVPLGDQILKNLSGRLTGSVVGAEIGGAIGKMLGAYLAGIADDALLVAIGEGVLDGALLGTEFGPLGMAAGALVGALAVGYLGYTNGPDMAQHISDAIGELSKTLSNWAHELGGGWGAGTGGTGTGTGTGTTGGGGGS
ncbi:hypothetical protein, partial [Mesorhizobium sp. B1-1-5]|uniref:hypothetical protein n=1 Tax=Mesorhizobium sp. B1-1-5 TaxID=2589979 RepID=UPI00116A55FD